jgi:hypothetical protein
MVVASKAADVELGNQSVGAITGIALEVATCLGRAMPIATDNTRDTKAEIATGIGPALLVADNSRAITAHSSIREAAKDILRLSSLIRVAAIKSILE